jgi:hypothetical protein
MSHLPRVSPECFAAKAASFASLHDGVPTRAFVANLEADVHQVDAGGLALPVTVNDETQKNAWVCSPLTTYSDYALEETRRMVPRLIAPPLSGVISLAGRWMRHAGLDRAISVNNWLISTNLYPPAEAVDLDALVASCRSRWHDHAIWFRSLNHEQHADWMRVLVAAGFDLIPTRQVWLFRQLRSRARQHQNLWRDLHLLRTTPLEAVSHDAFTDRDFAHSETLYAQLYLDKYSRLNPGYTAAFLKAWHREGLLEFAGFRDRTGQLRAVVGMFGQGSLLTAPIVGYDTAWPQEAGLYRLLMAHVLKTTIERDAELNLSAGAAHFKRLRGGTPAIEYSAVFGKHLPRSTRRALDALRMLTTKLGVPLMKRFEL